MLRDLSAADCRHSILEAVAPVFAKQGRANTTTNQLAKAAGISEAHLYKHFSSKEELYSALEKHCVDAIAVGTHLFDNADPSTETFVLAVATAVHAIFLGIGDQKSHEDTKRLIVSSLLSDGSFAKAFLAKHFAPWLPHFRSSLKVVRLSGHLEDGVEPSDVDIWFIHHLATSLHLFELPDQEIISYEMSRSRLADRAIVFLLRGIGLKETAIRQYYSAKQVKSMMDEILQQRQDKKPR